MMHPTRFTEPARAMDLAGASLADAAEHVAWLRRLTSRDPTIVRADVGDRAQRARAVHAVGPEAVAWTAELGLLVAERIGHELPAFSRSIGGYDTFKVATGSTTLQLLLDLSGEDVVTSVTTEALAGVTDFVLRRVSMDDMLRGIQIGHSVMASEFLAAYGRLADTADSLQGMRSLSDRMFRFFDRFSREMTAFYRDEERRLREDDSAVRRTIVEELLSGLEVGLAQVKRLGYDLDRPHTAVLLRHDDGATVSRDALVAVTADLLHSGRCTQRLTIAVDDGVVWGWATLAGELDDRVVPAGFHASVGRGGPGLDGFRASHLQARAGHDLLLTMRHAPRFSTYDDVDLLSLLLADRERALAFSERELGPLDADTPQAGELRRTLAAYIDELGSPNGAARLLEVSRNTVSYRIRRVEELLGRPVSVRRLHLRSALFIRDLLDRGSPA